NFRQTLDSLQKDAHSVLLLTAQSKEIEAYLDSTKNILQERAKELESQEESIKGKAQELEDKEEELSLIKETLKLELRGLEKKREEFHLEQVAAMEKHREEVEQWEAFLKTLASVETSNNEKLKELDGKIEELGWKGKEVEKLKEERAKDLELKAEEEEKLKARAIELELKVKEVEQEKERISAGEKLRLKFEPLVSLLAKNVGSNVTPPTDSADDFVKKNAALSRMIPYLDPAKVVLDAIQGFLKEYLNKDVEETDDGVVKSCNALLEKLIGMDLEIRKKAEQEATQLGVDWLRKAKNNPNKPSLVLGCLLFLAAYGLSSLTTRHELLTLLEPFLSHDQAPKLFQLLDLKNRIPDVVISLRKKDDYLAKFRFFCEFRSSKLCPGGRPGALLLDFFDSSEKAARVIAAETKNSMEKQKAWREKKKADAVMALECIRKKRVENLFPAETFKHLIVLANDESSSPRPVHKSYEKGQSSTSDAVKKPKPDSSIPYEQKTEAKRQRLSDSKVSVPSVVVGESGVNRQADVTTTHASRAEIRAKILSGSINADMLRKLVGGNQPIVESDLSNAFKCTPDPAKLVLDTCMTLCPTSSEFKLLIDSPTCSVLLNHLEKQKPQIGQPLKGYAKKLAAHWKYKISNNKADDLEIVCFLQFLGIFGIVSEFKAYDLLALLDTPYWRNVSPDLCQSLGLDKDIIGFIQNLIRNGRRIKAIDYIFSFDMAQTFHPVSAIIKDSLRIIKELAEKSLIDLNKESAPQALQVAAIDRQIRSLRAAMRCISTHKLESEFPPGSLEEQIKSLSKLRRNPSSGSGTKQAQTENPPNGGEIVAVTSNAPPREAGSSSVSKPSSSSTTIKHTGHKRSLWESNESWRQVASHPRNHYHIGHGYSQNQRRAWEVDHYRRGFTGTPNNYQFAPPDHPQINYQLYQPFNPPHNNHF
ncbi:unnamed protein product, partial [Microthlaspi erraticum]